jgi:hypothetical protein
MALTNCPECGKQVSTQAPTCPHCGYPIAVTVEQTTQPATAPPSATSAAPSQPTQVVDPSSPPPEKSNKGCIGCLGLLVVLLIMWGISKILPGDPNYQAGKAAGEEQLKAAITLGVTRFPEAQRYVDELPDYMRARNESFARAATRYVISTRICCH